MKRKLFAAAIFSLLSALCVFAQQKDTAAPKITDFSGSWQLDVKKSNFDQFTTIAAMNVEVAQDDKKIAVDYITTAGPPPPGMPVLSTGPQQLSYQYNLDGTETTSDSAPGPGMSTAKLRVQVAKDGDLTLISERTVNRSFGKGEYNVKEKWSLSDKGKVLKISRQTTTPVGSKTVWFILNKIG